MDLFHDLSLTTATPDDAMSAAQIITEVAEGMLELIFAPLLTHLGFASVPECISWALRDGQGAFSLEHIALLRLKDSDELAGLCFAYPQALHAQLLPDIVQSLLPHSSKALLAHVLPQAAVDTAAAAGTDSTSKGNLCGADKHPGFMYLNTLWVNPQYRRLHMGALLLHSLMQQAQQQRFAGVVLHCFNGNAPALALYTRCGFVKVSACTYPGSLGQRHPQGGSILQLTFDGNCNSSQGGGDAVA